MTEKENQLKNHELSELFDALISESITQEEFQKLSEQLVKDPEARRAYIREMKVEYGLMGLASDSAKPPFPNVGVSEDIGSGGGFISKLWFSGGMLGLLGLCVFAYYSLSGSSAPSVASQPVIAHAENESADAEWFVEETGKAMPGSLRSGDVLRVVEGRITVRYNNGVAVDFVSPAACELVSSMEIKMLLGSLTAEVPEGCKGFSVEAPRATVVDLGTKFRVDVDQQGSTDVVVFKGEVDVDYRSKPESSPQRLKMGEAVRLDPYGAVSRIDSIRNSEFIDPQSVPRSVLIEEVRDNYDRDSSLSYYEIVQNGMREDALAFVDREAHQWNGIDESGMPDYLIGGDYVRTFNNDKSDANIRLEVKITSACKLYILFDNRLPLANWLKEGFEDTGDDIGLDNGPFFSNGKWHNKGAPGVGPGQSIDDTFSVWVKNIDGPGVVTLGATESPISKPNMYGIVVVPVSGENRP